MQTNSFSHKLRVRFSEVDLHGHVFNINYILYFEIAIGEYLRHLDITWYHAGAPGNMSFYVKSTTIEYLAPIYFDQEIIIQIMVEKVGITSLTFSGVMYLDNIEEPVAIMKTTWVCVDKIKKTKSPLPESFKQTIYNNA